MCVLEVTMRDDNTRALGKAPAWQQRSCSSYGYREFHSKQGKEMAKKLHREGLIHTHPLGVEQMHPSAGKHLPAELGWQGAMSLAEGQGIGARRWKMQENVGYAHTCWAAASQGWESALNLS